MLFQSGSLKSSSASGSSSRATTDNLQLSVRRPPAVPLQTESPVRVPPVHTSSPDRDVRHQHPSDWHAGGDTERGGRSDWMTSSDQSAQSTRHWTLGVPLHG